MIGKPNKGVSMMPKGKMMKPEANVTIRDSVGKVRRNIDYGDELFQILEELSDELNISTQAIAKMAIQDWIDRHYVAKHYRNEAKKKKA